MTERTIHRTTFVATVHIQVLRCVHRPRSRAASTDGQCARSLTRAVAGLARDVREWPIAAADVFRTGDDVVRHGEKTTKNWTRGAAQMKNFDIAAAARVATAWKASRRLAVGTSSWLVRRKCRTLFPPRYLPSSPEITIADTWPPVPNPNPNLISVIFVN